MKDKVKSKIKKITSIKEAIKYLESIVLCEISDISKDKYLVKVGEGRRDVNCFTFRDDKDLLEYANEQKEAIEDC